MKLSDFLDVVDDDDVVEVYADDGETRPCKLKLVDAFNVSDWLGVIPDVVDKLEAYLDREVTSVATVKLDVCEDDEVVAIRVYVEQKKGDEDVRNKGVRAVEEFQVKTVMEMRLGPAVTNRDGGAIDLTEAIRSLVNARIRKGNLVPAFQGCWDMFWDGQLRFSVTKMAGYVYRVAIHVADGTLITADELQTTFSSIATSLGFGRYIENAWCDDHKVGYLGIVDGEITCAMDFDFTEGE